MADLSSDKQHRRHLQAITAEIIADYKEHYSFPNDPQGEHHMRDCIMDALAAAMPSATLSLPLKDLLQDVRYELQRHAMGAGLERASVLRMIERLTEALTPSPTDIKNEGQP